MGVVVVIAGEVDFGVVDCVEKTRDETRESSDWSDSSSHTTTQTRGDERKPKALKSTQKQQCECEARKQATSRRGGQ